MAKKLRFVVLLDSDDPFDARIISVVEPLLAKRRATGFVRQAMLNAIDSTFNHATTVSQAQLPRQQQSYDTHKAVILPADASDVDRARAKLMSSF